MTIWESPLAIRGGGPKESPKEEDDEWEEVYDEEDEDEEEKDMSIEEDFAEAVEEELQEEAVEDEEIVEEEEEESPAVVVEEVAIVTEEAATTEEEAFFMEERVYTDDENSSSFVDRMEARIANTNTDDENSSAFVDRMELADAYDEVDVVTDQEEDSTLAAVTAVTAATAIGGGDDSVPEDDAVAEQDAQDESMAVEPLELTKEIKDALKVLKYKSREIDNLRPDVAIELAEKGLQRPFEGIPQNWFVEGASIGVPIRQQALKISLVLTALGGLAFAGAKGELHDLLAGVPSVLKSLLPAKSAPVSKSTSSLIAETEVSLVPGEVEEEDKDDHPHSVKPNSTSAPAYEKDLDKSWLDKVITTVGNAFKAFWNAKI